MCNFCQRSGWPVWWCGLWWCRAPARRLAAYRLYKSWRPALGGMPSAAILLSPACWTRMLRLPDFPWQFWFLSLARICIRRRLFWREACRSRLPYLPCFAGWRPKLSNCPNLPAEPLLRSGHRRVPMLFIRQEPLSYQGKLQALRHCIGPCSTGHSWLVEIKVGRFTTGKSGRTSLLWETRLRQTETRRLAVKCLHSPTPR